MPTPYNAELRALRMKYKVAFAAHEACVQTLTEARLGGAPPSPELLRREAETLQAVNHARDQLIAAMLEAPGD
jgi:hypothetical protein